MHKKGHTNTYKKFFFLNRTLKCVFMYQNGQSLTANDSSELC